MPVTNEQVVRLYDTVFDRAPDAGGLAFWNASAALGVELRTMADGFMRAPEFAATYGQPTNGAFVEAMYRNVLDRPGEAAGVRFWTDALDAGRGDRADIVAAFSESPEHQVQMGAPRMFLGTGGADTITGTDGPDRIVGVSYDHMTKGGDISGIIITNLALDDRADVLSGGGGNDTIEGAGGNDYLDGGPGDDVLVGGPGGDYMLGGPGADTFRFDKYDLGSDVIADFEPGADVLDFRAADALFKGTGPFGTGPFDGGGKAQVRYEYDTSTNTVMLWKTGVVTQVYMDVNGDGIADATVSVVGFALNSSDFLV